MTPPNIILINCDDLGYGDLGCYGSQVNKTPNLDRMAAEGMRFSDFYMASPLCSPSRGAMMTGCYPRRIGFGTFEGLGVLFPGQGVGLSADEVTVAEILKGQGYATKIVGKWHCGDQPEFLPTRHGFDSYYGLPYSNDMGIQASNLFKPMPPLPLLRDEEVIEEQPDQASLTSRYVEESVRFLREKREGPFFLYFAHMHVHLPHYVAWRFLKTAINGPYGAAVECIDWSVGVLMHELKRLGLDERTLMIFTSDNGSRGDRGGSNLPLKGGKFNTWEGGLRVPCIMRWPGTIPAGTVSSEIVTSMDFLPTLARLAGAEPPAERIIDGKDVAALMTGQAGRHQPARRVLLLPGRPPASRALRAVEAARLARWRGAARAVQPRRPTSARRATWRPTIRRSCGSWKPRPQRCARISATRRWASPAATAVPPAAWRIRSR